MQAVTAWAKGEGKPDSFREFLDLLGETEPS